MADYGYVNARIRGMRSHLLGPGFYEQLIALEDLPSMIDNLEQTPYKNELEECVARDQVGAASVDEALKRNLARTFRKILSFMAGEPRMLTGILLARWDLHNLKSVLRGKHIAATEDEILKSLIPAGEIDIPLLGELAKQPDVKSVADLIITWNLPCAKPLKINLPKYLRSMKEKRMILAETAEESPADETAGELGESEKDLAALEAALDKFYYSFALKKTRGRSLNSRIVQELVVSQIDITNILSLLRIQSVDFDREYLLIKDDEKRAKRIQDKKEEIFIPKGKELSHDLFLGLSEVGEIEEVVAKLGHTSYGKALSQVMPRFFDSGSLAILQRKMEEIAVAKGVQMYSKGPLSMGVIASYIWAKYNEVVNLRIIVRGKAIGMLERRIREELIFV